MRKKRKSVIVAAGAVLTVIILIYGNILPGSNEQADIHSDQITVVQAQTNVPIESGATASTESGATASTESGANTSTDADANAEDPENPIRLTDAEGFVPGGYIEVVVRRVVDGDTIWAEYQGKEYKVRLLCIDTPESVKEKVKEQPFGKQAAEKLEEMILGKEVQLLFEKDIRDNYDRLLAYVVLEDGTCVNATMVSEGFARVNAVKPNIVHRDYFIKLQNNAINEGKGLWSLPEDKRPFVKKEDNFYIPRYYEEEAA